MVDATTAARLQVRRQIAHWSAAAAGLGDFEALAPADAWRSLEGYVGVALQARLREAVDRLLVEGEAIERALLAASDATQVEAARLRTVAFRARVLRVETLLDFYGDAVGSRTSPRLRALLRACDVLALRSMTPVLGALGAAVPPVLTYVDKGLGASILRAGLRLWDETSLSPVAAIKVTRHNLRRPTALIHETGHQVAHILRWNDELRRALLEVLGDAPLELAAAWAGWASEIAADVYAFVHCGYGSVAALHDVVAGDRDHVFRLLPGDPHPVGWIRVLLGVEMCRSAYGPGPWDDLAAAWRSAHDPAAAPAAVRHILERSVPRLPAIVATCLLRPMSCFGRRPIARLVDPNAVAPSALTRMAVTAGPALFTSAHLVWAEPLRLLALSSLRAATEPERASEVAEEYETWMLRLGGTLQAAA